VVPSATDYGTLCTKIDVGPLYMLPRCHIAVTLLVSGCMLRGRLHSLKHMHGTVVMSSFRPALYTGQICACRPLC
jgi:hypothetical protein